MIDESRQTHNGNINSHLFLILTKPITLVLYFFVLNTYVLKLSRENFMMWKKEPLQQKNTPPAPKRETVIKIVVSTSIVYLLPTYKDYKKTVYRGACVHHGIVL